MSYQNKYIGLNKTAAVDPSINDSWPNTTMIVEKQIMTLDPSKQQLQTDQDNDWGPTKKGQWTQHNIESEHAPKVDAQKQSADQTVILG